MSLLVQGELRVSCETCGHWWDMSTGEKGAISPGKLVTAFAFEVDRIKKGHVCETEVRPPERHLRLV